MAKRREARRFPTPTVISLGESRASMVISPTRSPARMSSLQGIGNGTFTKWASLPPPRLCSTITIHDNLALSPTSSSCSEDPALEKAPCASGPSPNSVGRTSPRATCSAPSLKPVVQTLPASKNFYRWVNWCPTKLSYRCSRTRWSTSHGPRDGTISYSMVSPALCPIWKRGTRPSDAKPPSPKCYTLSAPIPCSKSASWRAPNTPAGMTTMLRA